MATASEAQTTDQPRRLKALGDSADALFVVDHRQRIVEWNRGAQQLLGHARDDVLNRPCADVLAARGRDGRSVCGPGCPARTSVARDELPVGMEVQVRTSEGREVWLHFCVIVVPHEPRPLMVHVLHDVSDHRRASGFMAQVASILQANGVLRDNGLPGDALAGDPSTTLKTPAVAFTTREREVLRLLADGLSTKSIAVGLSVSPYTVRNHVQHLLAKSGSHNRAQLVSLVFRAGLL